MIQTRKVISALILLTFIFLLIAGSGCKKDEFNGRKAVYNLQIKDVLGVSGTATFNETSTTSTNIDIVLINAPSGTHPAELRKNSVVEGGDIVLTLNPVDANGKSTTAVTSISFDNLIAYDGYIIVHKSSSEPEVILAQGDIGGNVITSTNKTYTLETVPTFNVAGTALFEKRVNGSTLLTITLTGVIAGELYPATINLGSIETVGGGPVVKTLNNVDGTIGKSYTNIRKLNSGLDITYDNWLVYVGYINIYSNAVSIDNIICHGNIGAN
ncbi:MAG: hypothetical protein K0B37_07240 [Bacteroidales bacterium]|nr:hypothetical protein [Bacteroidales bacterium]